MSHVPSPVRWPSIVVGLGPSGRGDDSAGCRVASLLRRRRAPGLAVVEGDGDAGSLLADLEGRSQAVLVAPSRVGLRAGLVRRYLGHVEMLPPAVGVGGLSTLALGETIALARAMGTLPARVVVYTIEGGAVRIGDALSPEVEQAAGHLVERILVELHLATPRADLLAAITPAAWPRNGPAV